MHHLPDHVCKLARSTIKPWESKTTEFELHIQVTTRAVVLKLDFTLNHLGSLNKTLKPGTLSPLPITTHKWK